MGIEQDDMIPEAIGAIIETVFTYGKAEILAPVAGVAAAAIGRYLLGREEQGRSIIRSELERAGATSEGFKDTDQLAAAALRYRRAARGQAADENLRILAQAMIGLARRQELWASDFLKYAEILAPLSRDELIVIGWLMRADAKFAIPPPPGSTDLWLTLTMTELFPSRQYLEAVAARAQRSGLISPITGLDGTHYELSPIGREVRDVVDIPAALQSH
jgi:hypothetical protein